MFTTWFLFCILNAFPAFAPGFGVDLLDLRARFDYPTHCGMHMITEPMQLFFATIAPPKTDLPFKVKAKREEKRGKETGFLLADQLLPYRAERELMADFLC